MSDTISGLGNALLAIDHFIKNEPQQVFSIGKNIIFDWGKELNYLPKSLTAVQPIVTLASDALDFTSPLNSWAELIDKCEGLFTSPDYFEVISSFLSFLSDLSYSVCLMSSYALSCGAFFEDTLEVVSTTLGLITIGMTIAREVNTIYYSDEVDTKMKAELVASSLSLLRSSLYLSMLCLKTAYKPYVLTCTTAINVTKLAIYIMNHPNETTD